MKMRVRILGLTMATVTPTMSPSEAVRVVPFGARLRLRPERGDEYDPIEVRVTHLTPIGRRLPKGGAKLFNITAEVVTENRHLPVDAEVEGNIDRQWKGHGYVVAME